MDTVAAFAVVFLISGVTTLTDLSSEFKADLAASLKTKWAVLLFVFQGGIAVVVFSLLGYLKQIHTDSLLHAIGVGIAFPVLLKSKITTIKGVDIGLEPLYLHWTSFFKERINDATLPDRIALVELISAHCSLDKLQAEVRMVIRGKGIWDRDRKDREENYVEEGLSQSADEESKKEFLIGYILENVTTARRRYLKERGLVP